jgi:outer membrane protein assembly factor BamD (BamD/ComL family)
MPFRTTAPSESPQAADLSPPSGAAYGLRLGAIACLVGLAGFIAARPHLNYQSGASAYRAGDCQAASAQLDRVIKSPVFLATNDVIPKAQVIVAECQRYSATMAEPQLPGKLAQAAQFVQQYPQSPLKNVLFKQLKPSLDQSSAQQLAQSETCQSLEAIRTANLLSPVNGTLPQLYQVCGNQLMQAGRSGEAIAVYEQFMTHFQQHSLYQEVAMAYAKAAVKEAQALNPGSLPAPMRQGGPSTGQNGGNVTLQIRNNSPETMRIIISGATPRVEEIPPCPECQVYAAGASPQDCPSLGPQASYVVQPGNYDVVVKSMGSGSVVPFTGSWDLNFSGSYESCFFLSRSVV